MEYRIISKSNMKDLVEEVNSAIKEGWRPQGGVSVTKKGLFPLQAQPMLWAQAMVK
ncbi:MAG: DUF1737 domain-containing protein [Dehalococcoidia bacterium]|nr:DUF1737 domain-containing protein [Dehalococcoidia bacterium]